MALHPQDARPKKISLRDAYEKISTWYQAHSRELLSQPPSGRDFRQYIQASLPLVDMLSPSDQMSDLEIRAVLLEVMNGGLEWGYHQSDGMYKMAAYADAAEREISRLSLSSQSEDKRELGRSRAVRFYRTCRRTSSGSTLNALIATCMSLALSIVDWSPRSRILNRRSRTALPVPSAPVRYDVIDSQTSKS